MLTKKCAIKEKITGALYKVIRADKEILNEDKRPRFIVGDIVSILIEGTINVLNFRTRGIGMVFCMWAHKRAPFNSQWPVLENGGADFHHHWFVDSM